MPFGTNSHIDDIGYPTTKGYVKRYNVKSRKIEKRHNSKRQRQNAKLLNDDELIIIHSCKDNGNATRCMSEKEHHRLQRKKDINRDTIRKLV
jgi:exopolysaccharide biosynthesis protein